MKAKLKKLMVLFGVLAVVATAGVANAELVALWKFDESGGRTTFDSLGRHDGTLYGNPRWRPSEGRFGGALEFDGDGDYVRIIGYEGITGAQARTVMAWIKTTTTGGSIITWGTRNYPGGVMWELRVHSEEKRISGMVGAVCVDADYGYIIGDTDVRDGAWHHVAAVLEDDGSTDVNEVKLYVDGKLEHNNLVSGWAINTARNADVKIGFITSRRYFKGLIDEVAIFDHALSSEEVAQLYNHGTLSILPEPLQILIAAVREAKAIAKEGKPKEAAAFLEKEITECQRRRKRNPDKLAAWDVVLSESYFQLAKAKEAAGSPKDELIAAHKQAIFTFNENWAGKPPLVWLFENLSAAEYKNIINCAIQNSNDGKSNYRNAAGQLVSNGNWLALKSFLDVIFSETKDPVAAAKSIEAGLRANSAWKDKYLKYCRGKSNLTGYVYEKDCRTAEAYAARGDFKNAAKTYRDIIKWCSPGRRRSEMEFKVCECIFRDGQYRTAISELDRFLAKNKAANRSLSKEAILMKGQCYIQLGEIDKAINEFLTLGIEYPETKKASESTFFVGYCYMLQGRFDEAKQALNLVVKDYPQSSYASKARLSLTRIENMTK